MAGCHLWLKSLGAEVYGYALNPPTTPNLFTEARVSESLVSSTIADIRDAALLEKAMLVSTTRYCFSFGCTALSKVFLC